MPCEDRFPQGVRMYISRVAVENFRNFRHLVIDPFPRTAVLVGENGIGKSNLLHALRLVLDPDLPDSARRLRPEDVSEHADSRLEHGVTVRVEVDIAGLDNDLAAQAACDGCFVRIEPPLTARLTYVFEPMVPVEDGGKSLTRDHYHFKIVGGPNGDRDARWLRQDISLTVLPALRDAADALSRWRGSPLQELLDVHRPSKQALADAAEGIQGVMDGLAGDDQIKALATLLSTRLAKMAGPQMDITPTLGFASSVPERLLRSLRLFVDAERSRSVTDTSTGNANVIYLGLLLERLPARRLGDDVVDYVLAVEEPEAHIHPVLQRQLFRYLIGDEMSLVVSTHSPHIAAVTRLDALILLRRDPGGGGTIASSAAGAELDVKQRADIQRYLDVSRAELLFCAAAILVEGVAEVYLLPALARALEFDLDAYGVIITSVSGTDFAPYRKVLADDALSVPHAIVTDGDRTKKGKYVLAGLRRAAALSPKGAANDEAIRVVDALIEAGPEADIITARCDAADRKVYVGVRTLEVDIAPLLADQMISAMHDLESSADLRAKFTDAAQAVRDGDDGVQQRTELLRRINYVSKGRFAQRLAEHVENSGETIGAVIREDVSALRAEFEDGIDFEDDPYIDAHALMKLGTYGYLLAALNYVSWTVRNRGLLLMPEEEEVVVDDGDADHQEPV